MAQLLPPVPRIIEHTHLSLRHEGARALNSCGIPCVLWGEDLLRHFEVPTLIFDRFFLVANPEVASSKIESFGFHRLPPNPRYRWLEELTQGSIRLSNPSGQHSDEDVDHPAVVLLPSAAWHFPLSPSNQLSDIVPPLHVIIESYIDTWLDAKTLDFCCHLRTHIAYLKDYVKDVKDSSFPGLLRYGYQQDFWRSYLKWPIHENEKPKWRRRRQAELVPVHP